MKLYRHRSFRKIQIYIRRFEKRYVRRDLAIALFIGTVLALSFQNCGGHLASPLTAVDAQTDALASPPLPTASGALSYAWVGTQWNNCSKLCGSGSQTRTVQCTGSDGKMAAEVFCPSPKPAVSQICNSQTCATSPPSSDPDAVLFKTETTGLMQRIRTGFWNQSTQQFYSPSVNADMDQNNNHFFWPTVLTFKALAEGEKRNPGQFKDHLYAVFNTMDRYYNSSMGAYNSQITSSSSISPFYDDNALAIVALVRAFQATGDAKFLSRAWDVQWKFIYPGLTRAGNTGGMYWCYDPTLSSCQEIATSATSLAALGALLLAGESNSAAAIAIGGLHLNHDILIAWGAKSLDYIKNNLVDPADNLVMDGLVLSNGAWVPVRTKWTYNTGMVLFGYILLYQLKGEAGSLATARVLASASIDHNSLLFDHAVTDANKRYWNDDSFFVNDLVEGLVSYYLISRDENVRTEILRESKFALAYIRDSSDGLYWRNWRLWTIDSSHLTTWNKLTGQQGGLSPDAAEHANQDISKPLVKTLLANAGVANLLWHVWDLFP